MESTTHETAYVIHDFNATNEDEISLKAGEPVLVLEKDDLYNDGWWQGQNVRGEIGLFPMNFITLIDPLSPIDSEKQNSNNSQQASKTNANSELSKSIGSVSNHNPYFPSTAEQDNFEDSREAELSKQLNNALNLNSPKQAVTKQTSETEHSSYKPESNLKNSDKQPSAPRRSMYRQSELYTGSNSKLPGNGQPPYLWDTEAVAEWLTSINLERLIPRFQHHEIDGEALLALNLDTLKEIGITEFGKRFNVNTAITHLKRQHGLLSESESNVSTPYSQTPSSVNGSSSNLKSNSNQSANLDNGIQPKSSLNKHKNKNGGDTNRHQENEYLTPSSNGKYHGSGNNLYSDEPIFNEASNFVTEKTSIEKWLQSSPGYHPVEEISEQHESTVGPREVNSFTDSDENISDYHEDEDIPDAPVGPPPPSHTAPPPSYHSATPETPRPAVKKQVSFSVQTEDISTIRSDRSRPPPPDPELISSYKPPAPQGKNGVNMNTTSVSYDIDSARPPTPPQNPDVILIAGWLRKQGKTCKLWNDRWCVLKGHRLLLYYSDKEKKPKGEIDLRGYKPIPDPTINPGKYCFKLVHPQNKPLYFAAELKEEAQDWIKSLMKVAINRDISAPVVTSCTVNTVPLHVARKLAPRPPSSVFTSKDELDNDLPH